MASTYTDLGVELMATGENAGTWGTKTNANLNLIEQLTGGFLSVSIAGGAGTQALDVDDGAVTGEAQNKVLEFTGSITGNRIITWPVLTENFYIIKNSTSGAYTVQLKAASGSGATVTFSTTEKGYKIIYLDGVATNTGVYDITSDLNIDDLTVNNLIVKESLDVNGTIKLDGNYPVGTDNVALGNTALDDGSLSGASNTAIGSAALTANTTGAENTAVGKFSLYSNTTAGCNTAVGFNSLCANTTGDLNVAVGYEANVFNTTGERQVSVGYQAMCANTTGSDNVATGWQALRKTTTGERNTAVGSTVMRENTTGIHNTAVGWQAAYCNTTGCCNTEVGYRAAFAHLTGNNNTSLGHTSEPSTTSVSNQFTLGNASVTNLRCNDTSISSLSDDRDKENIEDVPFGLDYILALRPVKFDWNRRDGTAKGLKDFGFIAQELDQVEETFGNREYTRLVQKDNPEKWEADPMKTYPILIKAIQELKAEIELLKNK